MSDAAAIAPPGPRPSLPPGAVCRRAAIVLLFFCLSILQGLAPLLHVHLNAPTGDESPLDAQRGVHMPVRLAHASHALPGLHAACADMDDSAVITSPSELKRDEPLAIGTPIALHRVANIAALSNEDSQAVPTPRHRATSTTRLRPPAHAPPRIG